MAALLAECPLQVQARESRLAFRSGWKACRRPHASRVFQKILPTLRYFPVLRLISGWRSLVIAGGHLYHGRMSLRYSSIAFFALVCTFGGGIGLAPAADAGVDPLLAEVSRGWKLLEAGNQDATVEFVDRSLASMAGAAKAEARTMTGFAMAGKEFDHPKVNAAGTLSYLRARALERAGKRNEWLAALRQVWTDYPFCQTWDPQGWFWKPGLAAKKEGYVEIIAGAVRDRSLRESPFPATEDALDYPQMSIALATVVSQTLERGDHAGLEYLARRIQEMKLRFPDGDWALTVFFTASGGAAGPQKEEAAWELARDRIAAWQQAFPDSPVPRVAEAHRLIQKAWHVRGSGFADKVKPEAWPVFKELLGKAGKVLDQSPRTCPEWYEERLTVARTLDTTAGEQHELFEEGLKAFPGYLPLLNAMTVSQLPRWGGQPGDAPKFARQMGKTMGAKGYALVMNQVWSYERETIMEEQGFDAVLYRKGLIDLMDEHRGSLSLIHRILVIALSLKDEVLAREAFRRAGEEYHPTYWTNSEDYLGSRKQAGVNPE